MRSCLYHGTVWHSRSRLTDASKPGYRFAYSVWYLGLDLAERDEIDTKLRLFSRNRFNLASFWDKDYVCLGSGVAPSPNPPGDGGLVESGDRRQLVTMPRFLNFVFNPFSVLMTRNASGAISAATAEVHNTWGEKHLYRLERQELNQPSSPGGRGLGEGEASHTSTYIASIEKQFYVSPFISPEGWYEVELQEDASSGRLLIRIDEADDNGTFFRAGIDVTPLPLTDVNLLRLLVRFPFVNLKTVAMIHYQGLKLWLQGEPFRRNPSRAGRDKRPQEATR